ncbi:hypothetical protein AK88_02082 [Plasmodium fragile]|uniref:Tryptophan/threonine-rich plasmodium antigen C-terminal domain-containing protein n=1 Tax=Plasmodium fragile TaxID=5857 RepID=A0A0D9QRK0_PLAFR|nr:uncharacterized protein AK88_02082 [Plasmodium fragile]KJP88301.1 hypothetical protein AK88_02082 [Plasmodium fragile]
MKIMLLLSYVTSMLSILSSASDILPALSEYVKKYKTKTKTRRHHRSTTLEGDESMDMPEEWKEDQWGNFMKEVEDGWGNFNTRMKDLTSSWFDKKELEWEAWLKAMKNRWSFYNKNMDECVLNVIKNSLHWTDSQWEEWVTLMMNESREPPEHSGDEYILDVFRKNTTWSNEQWKEWIRTIIRESMENDWKYWVEEDKHKLENWRIDNFDKWKNKRMKQWKRRKWKAEEDEYWANWEINGSEDKSKEEIDKKNWAIWKERTDSEERQWEMYTERKKQEFLSKPVLPWIKWKNERTEMFEKWKQNLLATWIKEKEWHVWLFKDTQVYRRKLY